MTPEHIEALTDLAALLDAEGHRVVIIGAFAREVTFDRAIQRAPHRMTLDVDAAVHMRDWDEFERLAAAITATGHFRRTEHDGLTFAHRNGTAIDLLPYGAITHPDARLRWPNDPTRSLSMEGFDSLADHAVVVRVGSVTVAVADLPHLVALKLFAFADRADHTAKDLEDLVYILRHATDALRSRVFDALSSEALMEYSYLDYGPLLIGLELSRRLDRTALDRLRSIVPIAANRATRLPAVHRGEGADGPEEASRRFDALMLGLATEHE